MVPGFILHTTLSMLVPQRGEHKELSFIRFLTLSCINYALWSWLIYLLIRHDFFIANPIYTAIVWWLIILVSPVLVGVIIAHFHCKETFRKALQRFGINPVHPIPTAWDYRFYETNKPVWVLVTMKDGSQVAGLFGSRSFASSEPGERDLYIQEVFRIDGDEPWQRVPESDGILILGDQIKHIEFWKEEEVEDDAE
ncbi:hypothetical protein MTMBA_06010 [Moorella thermoacetica]